MSRIKIGFRRMVSYTVSGVALLAFALFLRAWFMAQSYSAASTSPIQTPENAPPIASDPFGVSFFPEDGDDLSPAWSPDERYIAYVSVRNGRSYLLKRDLQTNEVTHIAEDAGDPIWSPDGTHLAYGRSTGNENQLYVTNPEGTHHVKVNDATNAAGAMWLPDSRSLVFSVRRGEGEVHIVSVDDSSARTIHIGGVWAFGVSSLSPDGKRAIGSGMGRDS